MCSRGAAAAGDCGDQDHGSQARLVEAGPWRLMTSGPRCGVLIVPATEVLLLCLVSGALPPHTHKIVNVTRQGIDVYRGSKRTSWCLFVVVMKQHQLGTLELSKLQPQSHMRVITAQEYEQGTLPLVRQWNIFLVWKVMGRCGEQGTGPSVMEAFTVFCWSLM